MAFEYVLETFPFDREKIFDLHLQVPSMKAKEDYINKYMKRMTEESIDIETIDGKKDFLCNWVLRDESLHLQFGINLIHNILEENPELLTEQFAAEIRDIIVEGVNLEVVYNKDLFPNGILGLNADYVNQYVMYVTDRRLEELGLPKYYGATNPAKWMSTSTDVFELVNFFEAQNTSYEVDGHASAKQETPIVENIASTNPEPVVESVKQESLI